jgi:hypothetical protein
VGFEETATAAVEVVAGRLGKWGVDAAGRLTDAALDSVYGLISHRLAGSATGRRVLDAFERDPANPQTRARVVEMLSDEADSDGRFAHSLGRAAANAGIFVQGPAAYYRRSSGDQRNITVTGSQNVKFTNKRFHIGKLQFNMGGLVTGVAVLAAAAGGGAAAVVANHDSVELSSVVGEWTQQPGGQTIPGWTVGPISLSISAGGRFTFSMRATMSANDIPTSAGFGDLNLDCAGAVTPDGDHFTLRTTSGYCGTFEARPGPDDILDVFIENDSANGSLALTKA